MKNTDEKAAALLKKAINDGRNRNYEGSVRNLKKVLEMSDSFPEAMLYLGRSYHELGQLHNAVLSFRLYITNNPKGSAGYFYLGRTYIAMSRFERASSCFNESLKLKGNFAPALAYMGYSLMRTGRLGKSVEYLGKAVEADPDDGRIFNMYINSIMLFSVDAFRNENFNEALNGFQFIEQAGFSSITTILYTGIILKELRRYQESAGYIKTASEMAPDDELIKNLLAELYIRLSDFESSITLLSTYMNEDEIRSFISSIDNSEYYLAESFWNNGNYDTALHFAITSLKKKRTAVMHILAGECLKELGRLDDAFNHYSRAQELEKNTLEPLYGKAVILWVKKEWAQMLKILTKISRLSPDDEFAAYYKVLCSSFLELPYSEWKDDLSAIETDGKDAWILTAEGLGEFSEGNDKKAAALLKKSIKENDGLKHSWEALIHLYDSEPHAKQLKAVLKNYLKKYRSDRVRREQYISILIDNEDYSVAAEQYRILLSSSKPNSVELLKYAMCCRKSGKYKDAIMLYRQILTADPYNENYLKLLLYCMRKDGRDAETLPLLKQAVKEFEKPSLELLLVFGSALYRNDQNEEALNVFQKCIYDGYKDWRVFRNIAVIYKERGLSDWADMYFKKAEKLKS